MVITLLLIMIERSSLCHFKAHNVIFPVLYSCNSFVRYCNIIDTPQEIITLVENKNLYHQQVNTPRRAVLPKKLSYLKDYLRKKRKKTSFEDRNKNHKINNDIEEMNVEILLVNTLTITANKVQMVINEFLQGETYTNI